MATLARTQRRFDAIDFLAYFHLWCVFLLISGALIALTKSSGGGTGFEDRTAGSTLLQAMNLIIFMPAVLFLAARPQRPLRVLVAGWPYTLLLTLAVASTLWSLLPDVTLRRAVAVLISMLFVLHAASWFSPQAFLRQLGLVFAILLLLSVCAAAIPGYGIHPDGVHVGRWRGIFTSKNAFGPVCAIGCITFITLAAKAGKASRERLMWILMVALGLVLCILANSRTPLIGLLAAMAVIAGAQMIALPVGWQRRWTRSLRTTFISSLAVLILVILPSMTALVLTLLGRSVTLTGRTKLWEYAIQKGLDQPWLGVGFRSFWTDKMTFDVRVLHEHWGMEGEMLQMTANGHNAYLDVWLELGFVGLALFLAMHITTIVRAHKRLRRTLDPIYFWHIGVSTFIPIYYFANSYILPQSELPWFIAAYALFSLSAPLAFQPRSSDMELGPNFDRPIEPVRSPGQGMMASPARPADG